MAGVLPSKEEIWPWWETLFKTCNPWVHERKGPAIITMYLLEERIDCFKCPQGWCTTATATAFILGVCIFSGNYCERWCWKWKRPLSLGCSCVTLSQAHLCFRGFVLLGLLQLGRPGSKNEGLSRLKFFFTPNVPLIRLFPGQRFLMS